MTDRPILFSAPMIKALLAGSKTQTRRIVKPQPERTSNGSWHVQWQVGGGSILAADATDADLAAEMWEGLRVQAGDRLWVREAWRAAKGYDAYPPREMSHWPVHYEADGPPDADDDMGMNGRLRASMHMPRWASRLTLTVSDVRVQRLQDISEEDAIAEGYPPPEQRAQSGVAEIRHAYPISWYSWLWDSVNGAGAWAANPWVTATTFAVEHRNIDAEG